MANYFNTLPLREQLNQLGKCRFMDSSEFSEGIKALEGKKVVIVGCGAQGLNQGLNMKDSGLDISYTLRDAAIAEKRQSYINATENGFNVGTYAELIPTADLVVNLTPDKQHTAVVKAVMPLMKKVREEYKRGFGVPTLIAVHPENDPEGRGLAEAKAYAVATGGHRAGVLESSFVAEVKSDLMGEQTILCGLLQTGSILCFDKMVEKGIDKGYASKLIQYGWETITEGLKYGGITNMMDRLSNVAKIKAFDLSEELKDIMRPLFNKHMDDIISGHFSKTMMEDWANDDKNLLGWRAATGETNFEKTPAGNVEISEQEFYDNGVLMVAMVRAGVELAFEAMTAAGIIEESAYYESLHETPLIANTIARKKLYEMNSVISDTAEYGCYLFDHACKPLLEDFMKNVDTDIIGKSFSESNGKGVSNARLIEVNAALRYHPIEVIGEELRDAMTAMKPIV